MATHTRLTQTEVNALRRKNEKGKFGVSARVVDSLIEKKMIVISTDGRSYVITPQGRRILASL